MAIPNKIQFLAGNTLFINVDNQGVETTLKGFVANSGATIADGNFITIARQNGSDSLNVDWSKITTIIGKSGPIAKPTSKAAFYKMLFEEFLVLSALSPALPANASTESKQDDIITNQNTIIDLLDGPSHATRRMPTPTQANSPGTLYMMRTLKALVDTTIILKTVNVVTLTNDSAYCCLYKNPMIMNGAGITYENVKGSMTLQEGTIQAGSPTPQTLSGMNPGDYVLGLALPGDQGINTVLNYKINLLAGDVLFWGVEPDSAGLDVTMYQYYKQK